VGTTDLDYLEQCLIEARDALVAYWEQPEGQVCLLALKIAEDALAEWRSLDGREAQASDAESRQRIAGLADEVTRLHAPLAGTT